MNQLNNQNLVDAKPSGAILQRADIVWSRMKLEPGEVLLVKIAPHVAPIARDIQSMVDAAFGKDNDKVILFVDGDIEITKVSLS